MAIGLPAHAARKAILDFSLAWYADDTDQRFPEAWIRSVVKALTSDWNDPTRRARMKAAAEGQVDEGAARARSAALKASHDARVARQTEEARAALARTGGPQERDPRKLLGGIGS